MDTATAAALVMLDLAPLIEAGDFRNICRAEGMVHDAVATAPTDRDRGTFLHHMEGQLGQIKTPARPESDAYLRGVRAIVRRQQQKVFELRRGGALSDVRTVRRQGMSRERYTAKLDCPVCGLHGVADMSDKKSYKIERDYNTEVDSLPDGFKQAEDDLLAERRPILCDDCRAAA